MKIFSNNVSKFFYQILFFGALSYLLLTVNRNALYYGYDGSYMLQLIDFHFNWAKPWTFDLVMNPLQGLGNFTFPINYWFSPASVLTFFLNTEKNLNPILIYSLTAIEFFCSIWFLSWAIGASRFVQICSSWIGSTLIGLLFVPPSSSANFYPIAGLIPWIVESIAFSNVAIASILLMNRAEKRLSLIWAIIALSLIISLIITFSYSSILAIPLILTIFFTLIVKKRPDFISTPIGRVLVFLFIILLIPPLVFVAELVLYSVPTFFNDELIYGRPGLVYISIIFHGIAGIGWISTFIFLFGIFGAIYVINNFRGDYRLFAQVYLICSITLVGSGIILTFILTSYRGPSMLYFEWFLYPFMFIFTCAIIESRLHKIRQKLEKKNAIIYFHKFIKNPSSDLLIPVVTIVVIFIFNDPRQYAPLFFPQKETEISQYLNEKIQLHPGSVWQGSVVTFNNSLHNSEESNWLSQYRFDSLQWQAMGNDHRATGLWWYGIPTLFAYNQFMPPDYYFLITRLFAKPNDNQQRSVVVLSNYDAKLLQLLGVRYVINNRPILDSKNSILRKSSIWKSDCNNSNKCTAMQYLYELNDPNLGNYSPTNQFVGITASESIERMRSSDFDPRKDVILHKSISGTLESATSSVLIFEKGYMRVKANSPSQSLLVLPLQYSHCLEIDTINSQKNDDIELLRANVGLTAIRFSGNIDYKITLGFGPYSNFGCRLLDYSEARNFLKK